MSVTLSDIYRYPVKGLTAESLERVRLEAGARLPHDRRFAIAHGTTQFDPSAPQWLPKTSFFMLMRDEKLAQLRARFDPEGEVLTIERSGKQVVRARTGEATGRMLIGQFFASFLAGTARGTPKLVETRKAAFADVPEPYLSIINLASLRDLERVVRAPLHPLRFRANLYIEGAPPWSEGDWIGREIAVGEAQLKVVEAIARCAATNVNPDSAERDLNIPLALQRGFGHVNMGVYAEVTAGGMIAKGDAVAPPQAL